jgi:NADPH:quinone reductase-like Zn-dependent oxidoreductase
VHDHAAVAPGERVLITGASGGVGVFAVQLAKAAGGHVTAVCSSAKFDTVRELGADAVIDYRVHDVDVADGPFDAVIDIAGGRSVRLTRRLMTPRGRWVIVGAEGGSAMFGGLGRNLRAMLLSPFVRQQLRSMFAAERAADLTHLVELVERGELHPVVRTAPLADIADVMRDLEAGRITGKAVLLPNP